MIKLSLIILSLAALIVFSCRKDSFITSGNARIDFSSDTLFFDTVFTSTGSVTGSVKIINDNDRKLRLTSVKLMGGAQSFFHINIDGSPGPEQNNIELEAGDSMYVFVALQITPGSANLPFIIQDSIRVSFNGNQQFIQLQAWGQNAHFLRNQTLRGNTVWDNTLPYVILGGVQVDTNATLTIPAGCRVYLHADAPLLVDGSLQVSGNQYDSTKVYFQSDRLDQPYRDFPGSWPGIYFRGTSTNNNLQFAVIRNAYQAIVTAAPPAGATPKVMLNQCIIDNSYDAGILGTQGSIQAVNCLISNCGKNIELGYGGNYQFTHCTVTSYSNNFISHVQPVLSLSNYILVGTTPVAADLHAGFTNCIFWGDNGNVDDEVVVSQQGNSVFSVNFSNCLWKVKSNPPGVVMTNMIANTNPLFDSVNNNSPRGFYDFHLQAGSPAVNKGTATGILIDLDGHPRPIGLPDLGCYERQ
jgi:hypothetical protein